MMKALQLERPEGVSKGQPNALVVRDVPIPTVREGMVLVKVCLYNLTSDFGCWVEPT